MGQGLNQMIVLYLLRKGLEVDNVHFTLRYMTALASSSQKVEKCFERTVLSVTHRYRFSTLNPHDNAQAHSLGQAKTPVLMASYNIATNATPYRRGCSLVFVCTLYRRYFHDCSSQVFPALNQGNNHDAGDSPNSFVDQMFYLRKELPTRTSLAHSI